MSKYVKPISRKAHESAINQARIDFAELTETKLEKSTKHHFIDDLVFK
jgi:hypothetical protein